MESWRRCHLCSDDQLTVNDSQQSSSAPNFQLVTRDTVLRVFQLRTEEAYVK